MNRNQEILSKFKDGRVAVIGDLMLDVYLWGKVTRISPEAPVPVIGVNRRTSCPGGAANVMRNLATLGAQVFAFGVVGCDEAAAELKKELAKLNICSYGIIGDAVRQTTEKRRIIAGGQQLLREDFEDTAAVSDAMRRQMVDGIVAKINRNEVDAVIFEDYAKGVLAPWMLDEIIAAARRKGVITALDPKPGNLTPVKGLTWMKPNRGEAFAMAGVADSGLNVSAAEDSELAVVAKRLRQAWEMDYLLISLAAQGMALYHRDSESPVVIPTVAREVFDVSGAGDTVTATYTLAAVSGATPQEAAAIANHAAGVVVGKVGTAPIYFDELVKMLGE